MFPNESRFQLLLYTLSMYTLNHSRKHFCPSDSFWSFFEQHVQFLLILNYPHFFLLLLLIYDFKNLTDIAIQTNAYIKAGKVTEDMKGKIPKSVYEDSWELWVKYLAGELNVQEFLVE